MKKGYLLLILALVSGIITSQELFAQGTAMREIQPVQKESGEPIVCYFTAENMFTAVPLRSQLESLSTARTEEAQSANFEVTYRFFSADQKAAFQYAVDIWSGLLSSDVTIRIDVTMSGNMGEGTLASTGWGGLFANFKNAQKINTWYVSSLAEKMAREDLNDVTEPDIVMSFNSQRDFYTGLDTNPPSGQFDLVSIALHEIAHGLGFFTHTRVTDGIGEFGSFVGGNPTVYARLLENGTQANLFDTFENQTTALGNELTGGNLFFRSHTFDGGILPEIYAPSEWNGGSSISHLDESVYPSGNANSLMTPQIGFAEAIHDPGFSLDMLEDMGWISMNIDHDALLDNENLSADNNVVAVISGDNALAADGVNLHYTFSNWDSEVIVPMTSTGNPNEFSADIAAPGEETTVSYYLAIEDSEGRVFTKPGEAPEYFLQYNVGPDTDAPSVSHSPITIVLLNNPIVTIGGTVEDNIGAGPLMMSYRINGGIETEVEIPITSLDLSGRYFANHELIWDLSSENLAEGDLLEYWLSVTDESIAGNTTRLPRNDGDFYLVRVEALKAPQDFYSTDFNDAADDFSGEGFQIETPAGFSNSALHSNHPYRTVAGTDPDDTLELYQTLKVPIILANHNARIRFDEVVLVEPGEVGAGFGTDEFWDYVVVEGSTDFGSTWYAFENGYDSRAQQDWLTKYNSDLVTVTIGDTQYQDSEAEGSESLYREREIDMLSSGDFEPGDNVLIRFKMHADQLAAGWGWAIDNLKIQIDDEPPMITHIPPNYLPEGDSQLSILAKVTDNGVLDSVTFELQFDGVSEFISVDEEVELYELLLNLTDINPSSLIKYRIIAVDSAKIPNTTIMPITGFFEIPVSVFGDVKTTYVNDFNSESSDFIGANFNVSTPENFNDPGIQSLHPYVDSPTGISSMSYLLKYPIKTTGSHSWMSFNEIGLVDNFDDGLTIEVSNDNGSSWHAVVNNYSSSSDPGWISTFVPKDDAGNSVGVGVPSLFKNRLVDLLEPSAINSGDEILVRFTMFVNETRNGWGWAIDDLEIQGPTTAIEKAELARFALYPNPTSDGRVLVSGQIEGNFGQVIVTDVLGQEVYESDIQITNGQFNKTVDLGSLKKGIYILSIRSKTGMQSSRMVVE